MQMEISWEDVAFDDLPLVTPDATDLTVAGRRARFDTKEGQVIARGGGQVTRDIYSDLILDLDQGPLALRLTDAKGTDRQATLVGLGELAVAQAAEVLSPPAIDASLVAAVPTTIDGQPTLVRRVAYPAQELCARCDAGKALRAVLKAQGKTLADVSMLTASGVDPARAGTDDFRQPQVRALRVAAADASLFVEPVITWLVEGTGVEPLRTEGDGVIAVTRPGDQYNFEWTAVVYPEGDTVWIVTAPEPLRTELLAALPGAHIPPPIPTPAPTPTPDLSTPEGFFKSVMPATLGGEPLRVDVVPGAALFQEAVLKKVRAALKKQGKTIDDLSAGVGFTPSGLSIQGLRVAGGDAGPLVDIFLDQLRGMGMLGKKERPTEAIIGGKSTQVVATSAGTAYLYPGGEVLWIAQVPEATAQELFAALP
jgi:hypothetical protein